MLWIVLWFVSGLAAWLLSFKLVSGHMTVGFFLMSLFLSFLGPLSIIMLISVLADHPIMNKEIF